MRLAETSPASPVLINISYRYHYFGAYIQNQAGFEDCRMLTNDELTIIRQQLPRMQSMADRVIGNNAGTFFTSVTEDGSFLMLKVPSEQKVSKSVRSLIGWIELFGLE